MLVLGMVAAACRGRLLNLLLFLDAELSNLDVMFIILTYSTRFVLKTILIIRPVKSFSF